MTVFAFDLEREADRKPAVGMIVLQSDEQLETDARNCITPSECILHIARIPSGVEVTPETLAEMEGRLTGTAALFPHGLALRAVAYGCTSATSVIGIDPVHQLIRAGCDTGAVTEPVSALIHACRRQGITRLALLSPYVAEVSERLRSVLAQNGIETPVFGSFNVAEEAKVARIDGPSIIRAAAELGASREVEAVFLSCTNLNALGVLDEISSRTGKPAFSSNSVLIAHLRELAGLEGS